MKKTYNVIWIYVANYHAQSVEAETPEKAMEMVCGFYIGNPEFVKKSSIYVFEGVPVLEIQQGRNVTPVVQANPCKCAELTKNWRDEDRWSLCGHVRQCPLSEV